jgi:hypothetical protein
VNAKHILKANPYHDERGRFTSVGRAVQVRPQGLTRKNAPSRLAAHLQKFGGFTFDPKKSQLRRQGFAVAVSPDYEQVYSSSDFQSDGDGIIKRYLKKFAETLAGVKMHLGGWREKSGKVYLDVSRVVSDAQTAADMAREANQLAFFDLKTFTTWVRFRSAPNRPYRYLASGQDTRTAPIVGEIPIVNIDTIGKAQGVEGVVFCPVDSLLDDASIRKFVEQILATGITKSEPTSTDVHLQTIMPFRRRKRKTKKMMLSDIVEKGERLKDPRGGLTAAGRRHFKRTEGANLKPGVKGAANTPEKMRRKGSFLTRFFTNPRGPMVGDNGKPTRLALSAAAWGEPVPRDRKSAARLANKGRALLERYERTKKKSVSKANPYHDERGRFTSAGKASGGRTALGSKRTTRAHPAGGSITSGKIKAWYESRSELGGSDKLTSEESRLLTQANAYFFGSSGLGRGRLSPAKVKEFIEWASKHGNAAQKSVVEPFAGGTRTTRQHMIVGRTTKRFKRIK